jgi:hypothetical protein
MGFLPNISNFIVQESGLEHRSGTLLPPPFHGDRRRLILLIVEHLIVIFQAHQAYVRIPGTSLLVKRYRCRRSFFELRSTS